MHRAPMPQDFGRPILTGVYINGARVKVFWDEEAQLITLATREDFDSEYKITSLSPNVAQEISYGLNRALLEWHETIDEDEE